MDDPLARFAAPVREWFRSSFTAPSRVQTLGWPVIARGESVLLFSPTGTGKTLAAFLACIDRLMFDSSSTHQAGCRVLYVSPLKALVVDVERNLRGPLRGIAACALAQNVPHHIPSVSVRTGDTPRAERARFARAPSEILITTPESLYLLLTSNARSALRSVDTVIIDEIHALVPNKRGAHLMLSIERLQALTGRPLQRIGLSATAHPVEEVSHFLAGVALPTQAPPRDDAATALELSEQAATATRRDPHVYRPVHVIDAGQLKKLRLRIDVPLDAFPSAGATRPASPRDRARPKERSASAWDALHPHLLELVQSHRSTLLFVNSRRLAERLAAALNTLAGAPVADAHHGSLAREQRAAIEERLKDGTIRALVATSSLELGIDMGAIDLVVQIEAPASVASGLQRIGRAGHAVDAESAGVIVPKYRGDLLACAALTRAMLDSAIEPTRYPRSPLDVLAQQIVAMVSLEPWPAPALLEVVRRAAPFADLSQALFTGVLDMLAGRYDSEESSLLRPRITWDRIADVLRTRDGARALAIANAGTIADRGLYAVYVAGQQGRGSRIGELDEEMVFESRIGDTFVLGASSWRIEEITRDRVLVSPAPGEPGKLPFWHGEAGGRSLELGRAIGALTRELSSVPSARARAQLTERHGLSDGAAETLLKYLDDQRLATRALPDDRTIIIERVRDELGAYRLCVLSPFGGRVHSPWMLAAALRVREQHGIETESLWTDDGFVLRFPDAELAPDPEWLIPAPDELEPLLLRALGGSALFAGRFRENAARSLLLPRRRPGQRTPLWQQRKRAADLLAIVSDHPSFPILLETYRECLRDVFDVPALVALLEGIREQRVRTVAVDSNTPSPFASSLLFGYVANFIYDGDAPLAERRAQVLSVDHARLQELLGEAELRELLDPEVIRNVENSLQRLDPKLGYHSADGLHDTLLRLGALREAEIAARASDPSAAPALLADLLQEQRAIAIHIGSDPEPRYVAVEDAARMRDALAVDLPEGLPTALLAPSPSALRDLTLRFAHTHGPFTSAQLAQRFGLGLAVIEAELKRLTRDGKLLEGAFLPGGSGAEFVHPDVLRTIRARSLTKLREAIRPLPPAVLGRFCSAFAGIDAPRAGLDAILDAIERLEGLPLPASVLESEILRARVHDYRPADLDRLIAEGEVLWCGVEPLGPKDGRIALFLTDHFARLHRPSAIQLDPAEQAVLTYLEHNGASFFSAIHEATGGGYPARTLDLLWQLVFKGQITNDTLAVLRARMSEAHATALRAPGRSFRSRRLAPRSGEGRWSLLASRSGAPVDETTHLTAWAELLLRRYGLVTREVAAAEAIPGGFSSLYEVFRALEAQGRVRRGHFVEGVAAMQFALPGVLEQLRALREPRDTPHVVTLAATDPANPYGALVRPPPTFERSPPRIAGAHVILVDGSLCAYLSRGGHQLLLDLPAEEPSRSRSAEAVARSLHEQAVTDSRGGFLLAEADGKPIAQHPIAPYLRAQGFTSSPQGYYLPHSARGLARSSETSN